MEFIIGRRPTTYGEAKFSRFVRVYSYVYDYRVFNICIQWSHYANSACGWSITSKRRSVPYLRFRTALKFKRFGGLWLYRINQQIMYRLFDNR